MTVNMATIPADYEALSREQWTALANSSDGIERRKVSDAIKAWGVPLNQFMPWKEDQRVDFLMKKQEEAGLSPGKKAAAPATSVVVTAEEPKKTKVKVTTDVTSAPPAGLGAVTAQIDGVLKDIATLKKEIAEIKAVVLDTHLMVRVFFQSDEHAARNLEDDEIREAFYGKLVHQGNR